MVSLFVDYEFKKIFAVEFINHFGFYFIFNDSTGDILHRDVPRSKVIDLAIQILTSEDLALLAIQKSNFARFLDFIIECLELFVEGGVLKTPQYFIQYSLL